MGPIVSYYLVIRTRVEEMLIEVEGDETDALDKATKQEWPMYDEWDELDWEVQPATEQDLLAHDIHA